MGHARALLSLQPAEQILAANEIVNQGSSVRQAEKLVAGWGAKAESKKTVKSKPEKTRDDVILEEKLSDALGAPVSINVGRQGKGQILISFSDLDDMQSIIDKLMPAEKGEQSEE